MITSENNTSSPRTARSLVLLRREGFTIVEIMTVIAIMALLIAISVPVSRAVRMSAKRGMSRATINIIAGACNMYRNDFNGQYPPSTNVPDGPIPAIGDPNDTMLPMVYARTDGNPVRWTGAQLLCLLLNGYAPDLDTAGRPFEEFDDGNGLRPRDLYEDDGKAGFGFRLAPRGRVYGPYNGAEKVDVDRIELGESSGETVYAPPTFIDAFGNAILYYRFRYYDPDKNPDTALWAFIVDDNDPAEEYSPSGPPDDAASIMAYANHRDAELSMRTFILCSRGPDREWSQSAGATLGAILEHLEDSDDITNFSQ